MATYSFKSVGKTQEQKKIEEIKKSKIPFGIKTPMSLGEGMIFQMNYDLVEQMADNLKNLLMTNWGERLGLYGFGANLKPLLFNMNNQDDFDNEAIARIKTAVETWMPYVELENFSSTIDRMNKSEFVVRVKVTYNVPALEIQNKSVLISLYTT